MTKIQQEPTAAEIKFYEERHMSYKNRLEVLVERYTTKFSKDLETILKNDELRRLKKDAED